MERFIKVSLVGQGWDTNELQTQHNFSKFVNLIADLFHSIAPLDGTPVPSRHISISICDEVFRNHFVYADQQLTVKL